MAEKGVSACRAEDESGAKGGGRGRRKAHLFEDDGRDLFEVLAQQLVEHEHDAKDGLSLFVALKRRETRLRRSAQASRKHVEKRKATNTTTLAEHVPRKQQRRHGDVGGVILDELAVEEGELHEEAGDVLGAGVLDGAGDAGKAQPGFGGRVPDDPLDGREDVTLHLDERLLIVRVGAHLDEFRQGWNAVLCVLELGGDPQRSAADELVVLLEDDALRDIAVDDVEGEVEGFGSQAVLKVNLDEEVDKEATHVPLELRLLVDEVGVGHGLALKGGRMHAISNRM